MPLLGYIIYGICISIVSFILLGFCGAFDSYISDQPAFDIDRYAPHSKQDTS